MRGLRVVGNTYHVSMIRSVLEEYPECWSLARELHGIYHVGGWISPKKASTWFHAAMRDMTVHWIGSDVLGLLSNGPFKRVAGLRGAVKVRAWRVLLKRLFHLAGAPWLAEELRSVGVPAKYAPLPVKLPKVDIKPLPKEPTMVVYLPEGRERFYGWDHVATVAAVYPRTRWHIIAHSGRGLNAPENVTFHGWLPRNRVLDILGQSTALVRLVDHDGLSYSVLEALALGRYVIWNYDFPFCIRCNKAVLDLVRAINELFGYYVPNVDGMSYVHEVFDPKRTTLQLLATLKEWQG